MIIFIIILFVIYSNSNRTEKERQDELHQNKILYPTNSFLDIINK